MSRCIDADKLKSCYVGNNGASYESIRKTIDSAPTVDAISAVRCRECKMHGNCRAEDCFKMARLIENRRFCGIGERKDDGKK